MYFYEDVKATYSKEVGEVMEKENEVRKQFLDRSPVDYRLKTFSRIQEFIDVCMSQYKVEKSRAVLPLFHNTSILNCVNDPVNAYPVKIRSFTAELEDKIKNLLPEEMLDELLQDFCLAGGAVLNILTGADDPISDLDLFCIGDNKDSNVEKIEKWCRIIVEHLTREESPANIEWICTDYAITLQISLVAQELDIQFIKRCMASPTQVLLSFDLCPCKLAYHNGLIHATESALYAFCNKAFIIDPNTVSIEQRIYKHVDKFFTPLFLKTPAVVELYKFVHSNGQPSEDLGFKDMWIKYPAYCLMKKRLARKGDTIVDSGGLNTVHTVTKPGIIDKLSTMKIIDIMTMSPERNQKAMARLKEMNYDFNPYVPLSSKTLDSTLFSAPNFRDKWMIENPMEKMYKDFDKCETFFAIP